MVDLAPGAHVYLDANIVIYFVENFPEYQARIAALFRTAVAADASLVTSELTLAEVLVKPLRNKQAGIIAEYEAFLCGGDVELIPVGRDVLRHAAAPRADLHVKTNHPVVAAALSRLAEAYFSQHLEEHRRTFPGVVKTGLVCDLSRFRQRNVLDRQIKGTRTW